MSAPIAASTSESLSHVATVSSDGDGQVIHLPKEFHIAGEKVRLRQVNDGILLEPIQKAPRRTPEELEAMWAYIDGLGADPLFPHGRDQGVVEAEHLFD